jgi:hypothetical protein
MILKSSTSAPDSLSFETANTLRSQFCYASKSVPLIGFLCCEKYAAVAGSPVFVVSS